MRASASADPALIASWLAARSLARALPRPVADHGGWRVDTNGTAERRRYVFCAADPAIAALARTIDEPRVFLKLTAPSVELARLLPQRWRTDDVSWVMTSDRVAPTQPIPKGYDWTLRPIADAIEVRIVAADGSLAASGYAAEDGGVFVYDRIVTDPAHQRRGLGSAVMALLGSQRRYDTSRQVLVATEQGRALYATLGWQVHAPYASAVIPDPTA